MITGVCLCDLHTAALIKSLEKCLDLSICLFVYCAIKLRLVILMPALYPIPKSSELMQFSSYLLEKFRTKSNLKKNTSTEPTAITNDLR